MKIAWIHDHYFYTDGNNYYSRGSMPSNVWERYLHKNCELFVFGRQLKTPSKILSSYPGVNFVLSQQYTTFSSFIRKYCRIKREVASMLEDKDKVIIRLPSVLGLIAYKVVKEKNIPYMIEVVGSAFDSFNSYGNLVGKLLSRPYEFLMKRCVKDSKFVLYVTQTYLQNEYPCSQGLTVACTNAMIPLVDNAVLQNRIEHIKTRKKDDVFILGQIGNLSVPYKGYSVAIKAIGKLKKQGVAVLYKIAGNGSPEQILKMADEYNVRDCVSIVGPIPHNEIMSFYDSLDCYIHPSYLEGLPRVCVEAISRGCPCAVSDAGGTPELVDRAYLHHIGDFNKLAEDILSLRDNKDEMIGVASANFERAKLYYSKITNEKRKQFLSAFYNS